MDDMRRWRHTWTGIELAVQAMKAHDDQGVQEAAICLLCKLSLKVQLAARIKEVTGGVEAIERAVAGALQRNHWRADCKAAGDSAMAPRLVFSAAGLRYRARKLLGAGKGGRGPAG